MAWGRLRKLTPRRKAARRFTAEDAESAEKNNVSRGFVVGNGAQLAGQLTHFSAASAFSAVRMPLRLCVSFVPLNHIPIRVSMSVVGSPTIY